MEVDTDQPPPLSTADSTASSRSPPPSTSSFPPPFSSSFTSFPSSSSSPSPMPTPPPPPPPPPPAPSIDLAALFDSQRPLRPLLPPSHSLTIPIRLLNAELTCVVCLGILRQTTAVTFCLHRFCHSCIVKSLRFGKKECPQCRVGCPSHRNLRPDPVFDAIIAAIYPDLEGAEEAQEKAIEAMIDAANVTQFAESAMKGARIQAERAKERAAQQKKLQEQSKVEAEERRRKAENTAWIRLLPLPPRVRDGTAAATSLQLAKPHVKTTKTVTVELLSLYIRSKLQQRLKEQQQTGEEKKEEGNQLPSAASPSSSSPSPLSDAPSTSGAVSLRVSVWFRWADMTDLARRVWTQSRAAMQPPPLALTTPSPTTILVTIDDFTPASTATPAPSSAAQSTSPTSSSPAPLPSDAAASTPTPPSTAASITAVAAIAVKRGRERVVRAGYPVWCEGLVGREEAPDFVELAGPTTARFLYERHWDERRANAPTQQQLLAHTPPWRKLTLYYQVEQLNDDGRPAKKQALAVPTVESAHSSSAPFSAVHPAPQDAFTASAGVSPTSAMADTMTAPAWSPSGAASTSADAQSGLTSLPLPASTSTSAAIPVQ